MTTEPPPAGEEKPTAEPPGMGAFLLLWGGQVSSLVGTSMTRFALMIWGWEQTGEATTLALLGFFGIGTTVLLSPLAGVFVDRIDRKRMLVISDLGAGLTTLVLLLLYTSGQLEIWHIYAAAVVAGAFETFQFPAYSAATTLLLPSRHYARASGLVSLARTASMAFGPPVAAVLLPRIGYSGVFAIDLTTLTLAICLLLRVPIPAPERSPAGADAMGTFWREATFGFRYILARRGLLSLQLFLAMINFLGAFTVILRAPMILARTDSNALVLGNVQAVAGVGGILGGLLLAVWGGPRRRTYGLLWGGFLGMTGNLVLGLGQVAWVWAAGAFLFPLAFTLSNASNQAIWQAKVDPDIQGKVFAVRRQIAQLTALPAMLVAGPLADRLLEPAMEPGGGLAAALGPVLGTGPGAGIALVIVATSSVGLLLSLAAWGLKDLRRVEDTLPDHPRAREG